MPVSPAADDLLLGVRPEMINAARRAQTNPVGIDLEVVVGRPEVSRKEAFHLAGYSLGVYASRPYLETHPPIGTPEQVQEHPLIYFVDSMQDVAELDIPCRRSWPRSGRRWRRCGRSCSQRRRDPGPRHGGSRLPRLGSHSVALVRDRTTHGCAGGERGFPCPSPTTWQAVPRS